MRSPPRPRRSRFAALQQPALAQGDAFRVADDQVIQQADLHQTSVAVLGGGEPEINDTETYDNGVKVVPSYLLEPVSVDASNWEEILIGSGYYTEDQIK